MLSWVLFRSVITQCNISDKQTRLAGASNRTADRTRKAPLSIDLVQGILDQGELSAALRGRAYNDTAPKQGAAIPAAKAKDAKTGAMIELHQVRRPTVLVFGSWT